MAQSPAMGNAYEFRESMKAHFGYGDKTVEQVEAERTAREQAEKRGTPKSGRRGPPRKSPTTTATPRQSELERLQALMKNAKPRQRPASE